MKLKHLSHALLISVILLCLSVPAFAAPTYPRYGVQATVMDGGIFDQIMHAGSVLPAMFIMDMGGGLEFCGGYGVFGTGAGEDQRKLGFSASYYMQKFKNMEMGPMFHYLHYAATDGNYSAIYSVGIAGRIWISENFALKVEGFLYRSSSTEDEVGVSHTLLPLVADMIMYI